MRKLIMLFFFICSVIVSTKIHANENVQPPTQPQNTLSTQKVELITNMGRILIELNFEKAPLSCANFLNYVNSNYYSGTIFHRVIRDFIAQGGGYTFQEDVLDDFMSGDPHKKFVKKEAGSQIPSEAANGLKNVRGSVAMSRTKGANSASDQFFINLSDNPALDHRPNTPGAEGYTVFGKIIEGMDVVEAINSAQVVHVPLFGSEVPKETIRIESVRAL